MNSHAQVFAETDLILSLHASSRYHDRVEGRRSPCRSGQASLLDHLMLPL